jgi:DNA-binding transcriptional MerR regulator
VSVYSISDLADLTGIKPHTLRVWEKRYGLALSRRTEGNIRYYLEEDLRRLRMVAALYRKGLRISRIAEMAPDELESEFRRIASPGEEIAARLRNALVDLDARSVDELLDEAIEAEGFDQVLFRIVLPLLEDMEAMWIAGTIDEAHEAFFREQIRRKAIREIEALPRPADGHRVIMLLPRGNQQTLSHLFMHFFLRKQGIAVTDLGADIPLECALSAVRRCDAEAILLVNADPVHWQFGHFIDQLVAHTELPVVVSGRATEADWSKYEGRVIPLEGIEDTIRFVRDLRANLAQSGK